MKHVFGVSSHLVFYQCHKIIELDHLNPDDCIFFFTRNYHCPQKFDAIYGHQIHTEYNVNTNKGRIFEGIRFDKTRKNIKEFDSLVDGFIGDNDFVWYSQVCNNDICSLFVTKSNCKAYYILEDGLGSYRDFNPQTFTGWKYPLYKLILKPFFRRCFEVKNHFITTDHPKFKGCFATTPYCFPLHQQYFRCIGIPFEKIDLGFSPDAVISIDPLYFFIKQEDESKVYERLSSLIKQKQYNSISYKFHPYFNAKQNAEIKNRYQKMINRYFGDKMAELSSDIVLENVLMTYHCDFYTDNSSVAIYAHEMGCDCYTYIPILRDYTDVYSNVPLINEVCIPIQ